MANHSGKLVLILNPEKQTRPTLHGPIGSHSIVKIGHPNQIYPDVFAVLRDQAASDLFDIII